MYPGWIRRPGDAEGPEFTAKARREWGQGAVSCATNSASGNRAYTDKNLVNFAGDWRQRTIDGFWGLFSFNLFEADKATPAEISYAFPIVEDGTYQVSLLYLPSGKKENGSNRKNPGRTGVLRYTISAVAECHREASGAIRAPFAARAVPFSGPSSRLRTLPSLP